MPKKLPLPLYKVVKEPETGASMRLGALDLWVPKRNNDERAELSVSTEWLIEQRCPEHPFAIHFDPRNKQWRHWTHCFARMAPVPGKRYRRPSVVFSCPPVPDRPQGHLYEIVLPEVV